MVGNGSDSQRGPDLGIDDELCIRTTKARGRAAEATQSRYRDLDYDSRGCRERQFSLPLRLRTIWPGRADSRSGVLTLPPVTRLLVEDSREFPPRRDSQLLEHLAQVVVHRVGADEELAGNLPTGGTL